MPNRTVQSLFAAALAALPAVAALAQGPCIPSIANETLTPSVPGVVRTIVSYDDGSGSGARFFVGGTIPSLANVAILTPAGWQQAGAGFAGEVTALEVIPDGTGPGGGPALYAGGQFTGGLARWDGSDWQLVSPSPGSSVTAIAFYDDGAGAGRQLHVLTVGPLRKLQGSTWQDVASGVESSAPDGSTDRMIVVENSTGGPPHSSLFVASVLEVTIGSTTVFSTSGVVQYDQSFTALPGRPYGVWIKAAAVFDDGQGRGPELYISGHYLSNMISTAIARWDTSSQSWAGIGPFTSFGDAAYGLTPFNDGVGTRPRLYAIGGYDVLGETPQARVAAWDGQTWTPIYTPALTDATSMNYHFPCRAGVLGAAHVPALLCTRAGSPSSTELFAVVGCPRCRADTNLDGRVTIGDLFEYIDAWLAAQPSADMNGNGLSAQDIFDYLGAWFAGCE